VFFAVVFPTLLLVLFPVVFQDAQVHGRPMAQYLFAGMLAYAVAVAGYVDLPEGVAAARAAGVLKRLSGTPLPMRWHLAGRVSAALLTALLAGAVLATAGIGFLGVHVPAAGWPALLVTTLVGALCFASAGLAVAALLRSARSLVAVTLGTLLPICFASEIFVVGNQPLPAPLTAIAALFPPRHLLQALLAATAPDAGFAWLHLAVLAGWTALGLAVLAWRRLW
jgi:ABC-type multidrug transport system permease subunit